MPTRADSVTPGQLDTEEGKAARTVAAYAMVRAMLARDSWTMARILDRWATGPGTEGMDFAAAVAGVGAALAIRLADGIETAPFPRQTRHWRCSSPLERATWGCPVNLVQHPALRCR